jgi:cytoskeletal protein CcmA (bactofilin family)
MGSLSNLYISQSFQSLIHLGSDITASTTQVELEDGLGNGIGIYVNTLGDVSIDGKLVVSGTFDIEGKITVNDDVRVNGNLSVSGATSLTGSLDVTQNITASNALIENDLIVSGTLFASKVVTLIESSSIIYSSGSNILGDEVSDTQTLIGSVIMSGSASLTGSMGISNNLNVLGNISSSTISGIGNVSAFSQSVDARLDVVEATASLYVPFSTSVDSRLDLVEATASFLNTTFSSSVDARLDALEAFSSSVALDFVTQNELNAATASLINQIDTKLNTSSFNAYTQSVSSSLSVVGARINSLSSFTASYATTGSNTFVGNQTITGSLILSSSAAVELGVVGNSVFSGSVAGVVIPLAITSQTASMDCSLGNFFTLQLPSGSATFINPTNIRPGTTLSLRITQAPTGSGGTVGYSTSIKFPQAFPYIVTPTNGAIDILSFQSYDSSSLFGVAVNTMI